MKQISATAGMVSGSRFVCESGRFLLAALTLVVLEGCVHATSGDKIADSDAGTDVHHDSDNDTSQVTDSEDTATVSSDDVDTTETDGDASVDSESDGGTDTILDSDTESDTVSDEDTLTDTTDDADTDTGSDTDTSQIIFVVDAPNDTNITRRAVVPGDGTQWPNTVSQTFDHSTGGHTAAALSGTLHVSGTGFFEPGQIPEKVFNGDYAGEMTSDHTAQWTVTGYTPGKEVAVYCHWPEQYNFAYIAPFGINGADPINISLKVASSADLVLNDGVKDVNFQLLGTGAADGSGQVQVVLSGQDAWAPVDAMAFVSAP